MTSAVKRREENVSCVFRPLSHETLALGQISVAVQRQRQRSGLTLAHAAFAAPISPSAFCLMRWPIEAHAQAAVLLKGRIDFQLPDQRRVIVQAGQWFVASFPTPGVDCRITGDIHIIWFECSKEIWREFSAEAAPGSLKVKNCFSNHQTHEPLVIAGGPHDKINHLASELGENQGATIAERLRMEARSLELLSLLLEQPPRSKDHQFEVRHRHPDEEALIAAALFLEENLAEDHSLRAISREVHLNEFKLKKGFRERFDTTVFGYLRRKRMEHARRLLTEDDLTVLAVANVVGYSNPSHFARAFREAFGLSPSEIAKQPNRSAS